MEQGLSVALKMAITGKQNEVCYKIHTIVKVLHGSEVLLT